MAERKEYESVVITNLKTAEEGLPVKLDLDQDAWEFAAPPPKGTYKLKLFIAKDGVTQRQQNDNVKDVYYTVALECRIVDDGEYDGVPVFTRVDTRLFRGREISTMAGLLVKMGHRKPLEKEANGITPLKQVKYLELALKKEPIVLGEVDWRGSYQFHNDKGEETWANPMRHYEDFPMLEDKTGRNHVAIVTDKATGVGHDVRAQAFVGRFFSKDDTLPKYDAAGLVKEIKAGIAAVTPQLVVKPVTNNVPSPVVAPVATPVMIPASALQDATEDDSLLLE